VIALKSELGSEKAHLAWAESARQHRTATATATAFIVSFYRGQ
jgi:hypothetical protein